MDSVFSQLTVLGSSLVLITGLILLWRRGVTAYISAFTWQSTALSVVTVIVAYFGDDHELYWVAGALFLLKALVIPRLLKRMARRFAAERELEPYVNTATSLVISGLLVLFGYAITRPLVALSQIQTRAGMPLAMGLVLVSLFVVISRKKAPAPATTCSRPRNRAHLLTSSRYTACVASGSDLRVNRGHCQPTHQPTTSSSSRHLHLAPVR